MLIGFSSSALACFRWCHLCMMLVWVCVVLDARWLCMLVQDACVCVCVSASLSACVSWQCYRPLLIRSKYATSETLERSCIDIAKTDVNFMNNIDEVRRSCVFQLPCQIEPQWQEVRVSCSSREECHCLVSELQSSSQSTEPAVQDGSCKNRLGHKRLFWSSMSPNSCETEGKVSWASVFFCYLYPEYSEVKSGFSPGIFIWQTFYCFWKCDKTEAPRIYYQNRLV